MTPADLLVASMAAELISSTYLQASISGLKAGIYRATTDSMRSGRQTLYRMSYAGSASMQSFLIKMNGKMKAIKLFTCFEEWVALVDCDLCEHHV